MRYCCRCRHCRRRCSGRPRCGSLRNWRFHSCCTGCGNRHGTVDAPVQMGPAPSIGGAVAAAGTIAPSTVASFAAAATAGDTAVADETRSVLKVLAVYIRETSADGCRPCKLNSKLSQLFNWMAMCGKHNTFKVFNSINNRLNRKRSQNLRSVSMFTGMCGSN